MKTILQLIILIALFIGLQQNAIAQQNKFQTGIIAGFNFSELEGSDITDYFGLNVGLISTVKVHEKFRLSLELLFSQNGEYILPDYYPLIEYGKIRLNHIEVPLHLDWFFQQNKFFDSNINIGIAYTRLFGYYAEDQEKNDISDQIIYNQQDGFLAQLGLTYHFNPNIGLNLKTTLPITTDDLDLTFAARLIYLL